MIRILLHEHLDEFDLNKIDVPPTEDYLLPLQTGYAFLPRGRTAISVILSSLNLKPTDEIYITNGTGQMYIPSCVTCTVFNFCQPSRVLTEATRAILIIHEYGIPHPRLFDLVAEGQRQGIPIIEDCAHTFDSWVNGQRVGTFGDYAIYSLSKIFPMKLGGILVGKEVPSFDLNPLERDQMGGVKREFHLYGPLLSYFSQRRQQNFIALRQTFKNHPVLFEYEPQVTPYFLGVFSQNAWRIRQTNSSIQWGSTLRDDLLLIPTNPMIEPEKLVRTAADAIKEYART